MLALFLVVFFLVQGGNLPAPRSGNEVRATRAGSLVSKLVDRCGNLTDINLLLFHLPLRLLLHRGFRFFVAPLFRFEVRFYHFPLSPNDVFTYLLHARPVFGIDIKKLDTFHTSLNTPLMDSLYERSQFFVYMSIALIMNVHVKR